MAYRAPIVVPALKRHTATIIMMHGLGDSGAGWLFLSENWRRRSKFEEVAFVFPNAPNIPITLNGGMKMPGWYDIKSLGDLASREADETGILRSRDYIHSLIDAEVAKGIPTTRVVVGGFSQGGAMSLISGTTYGNQLGGIFGLSCYLLLHGKLQELIPEGSPNKDTPIFMGHGDSDQVVAHKFGKMSEEELMKLGYKVDFRTYKGLAHSADPEEIDHLEAYLNQQLPPLGDEKKDDPSL
ncbi:Phospholipase/carboxylesterase [Amniculicola lignicola CBS 123094]|uniref:Acyl-protein thioesterase 1 n=1 Tax=Amniculicola lignicola CBS 123094 TaxID=1392246 RepID=A0A6A5W580_9PLEO|nr:Phospholipase/carboxylesterase [Amniculicola lignicola CBS 123094]